MSTVSAEAHRITNGPEKTRQFVGDVSHQLPKEFGPTLEVAALRFVKEYDQYKKDHAQLDKNDPVIRVQEDPCVQGLNHALIKAIPAELQSQTPEQLGKTLQQIKEGKPIDGRSGTQPPQVDRPGERKPGPGSTDSTEQNKKSPEAINNQDVASARQYFEQITAKSPTLAGLYDRWHKTPYLQPDANNPEQGQILIKNDSTGVTYDSAKSRLVIGAPTEEGLKATHPELNDAQRKQVIDAQTKLLPELVAHQMYIATHQSLNKLYGADQPVSQEQYVDTRLTNTAAAYLSEIQVNRQLDRKEPVIFSYKDSKGNLQSEDMNKLVIYSDSTKQAVDQAKSVDSIKQFLTSFSRQGDPPLHIDKQFADEYSQYQANFAANRAALSKRGYLDSKSDY